MIIRLLQMLRSWWRRTGPDPAGVTDETDDPVVHDVAQTHDEVAGYWTDERLRAARPREQRLTPGNPDGSS